MLKDFRDFLKEYKIIGLAFAFIMGAASTSLINSLVKDIVMPIINPLLLGGDWKEATLSIGPIIIRWGSFLAELINFAILAFVVFVIAKKILKQDVGKKK